jgi:hypothetical protein
MPSDQTTRDRYFISSIRGGKMVQFQYGFSRQHSNIWRRVNRVRNSIPQYRLPDEFAGVMIGDSMSLETSYEVLEMLRDDGVQTFRAREKATGRALELHLFLPFGRPENKTLFEKLKSLPLETRKKFLDTGLDGSTPYLVTDPLPGGRGCKSWAEELIAAVPSAPSTFNPGKLNAHATVSDDGVQILQAGQWRTGTPIPDSLVSRPPARPVPPPSSTDTGDFTRMFKAPTFLSDPEPPQVAAPEFGVTSPPRGEFTGMFQAAPPSRPAPTPPAPTPPAPDTAPVGEFTGLFEARPSNTAPPPAFTQPAFKAPEPFVAAPPPTEPAQGGEFTRMFKAPADISTPPPQAYTPPVPAPPSRQSFREPEPGGGAEFTKYFENPLKPVAMGTPQPSIDLPPPPPPTGGPRQGDFTNVFGRPPEQSPIDSGFSPNTPMSQAPQPAGPVFGANASATGAFAAQPSWSQPQSPASFAAGPSEYTKMMSVPAMPGTPGPSVFAQAPSAALAAPAAKKSNALIFIAIGVVVVLLIAIGAFLLLRQPASPSAPPPVTTPATK